MIMLAILVSLVGGLMIYLHSPPLRPVRADALIILGFRCKQNQLDELLKERLNSAIKLVEEGYPFRRIIVSGGCVASTVPEAELMKLFLVSRGVTGEQVIVEKEARDTVENLLNCQAIMEREQLQSCLIISNSFHLRRVGYIAKTLGLKASVYGKRNLWTLLKQSRASINEVRAFIATLRKLHASER